MKKYIYCQTGQAYEVEQVNGKDHITTMEWANRKGSTTWVYLKDAKGIRQPVNMLLLEAQIHTTLSDVSELTIKKAFACSRSRQKSGYLKMLKRAKAEIERVNYADDSEWCADYYAVSVPVISPELERALTAPYKPSLFNGRSAAQVKKEANEEIKAAVLELRQSKKERNPLSLKELANVIYSND